MPEPAFLTEAALGRFLALRVDPAIVANKAVPGLEHRYRPDYRSEAHMLVVEFDGDQHYQRAAHVVRDQIRDAHLADAGYRTVRIPYFVQLTSDVIAHLFPEAEDRSPFLNFPHGFIADTVVFPCDFCELGVDRFRADLRRFDYVAPDIRKSLRNAIDKRGDWRPVIPPSLRDELCSGER